MEFDYCGKTAVITGGTSGIGLATAKLFGKSGANIAICGQNVQKLENALEELRQLGINALGVPCNVIVRNQVMEFGDRIAAAFGTADVWVNNAGRAGWMGMMKASEEFVNEQIGSNFLSAVWGSQAAFRLMRDKGGVIVNAASYAGVIPAVGNGMYATSKSAVISLSRTLAAELAPYKIRVVGYTPGLIHTGMLRDPSNLKAMHATISSHRIGKPEEVATLIAFLASDAAAFIDGTCVEISGGKLATQNIPAAWDKNNSVIYDPDHLPARLLEDA